MDVVDDLVDRNTNEIGNLSDLARRLAEIEPRQNSESWRKNLRRWRKAGGAKESDIAILARAFNIRRDELPAAKSRPSLAEVDRRLAALEAAVGLVEEGETVGNLLEELSAKLADALARIQELEETSLHGSGAAAPGTSP